MRFILYFELFVSLIYLSCSTNFNATLNKSGAISGIAKDINNTSLEFRSNILVVNTSLGCLTDHTGKFLLLDIPVGIYDIKATAPNFKNLVYQNVRIAQDSVTIINFEMIPDILQIVPSPKIWEERYAEIYELKSFINK